MRDSCDENACGGRRQVEIPEPVQHKDDPENEDHEARRQGVASLRRLEKQHVVWFVSPSAELGIAGEIVSDADAGPRMVGDDPLRICRVRLADRERVSRRRVRSGA